MLLAHRTLHCCFLGEGHVTNRMSPKLNWRGGKIPFPSSFERLPLGSQEGGIPWCWHTWATLAQTALWCGELNFSFYVLFSLSTSAQTWLPIKAWSLDVSGQPWGAVFIPDPHGVSSGHLASDPAWSFPLPYPVYSLLIPQCWPQGHPDTHPSTKLHPSLHTREPAYNTYQKIFQYWGGFLLKITGYTCIYNSLNPPQ